jgi:hypothetical protein
MNANSEQPVHHSARFCWYEIVKALDKGWAAQRKQTLSPSAARP